MAEVRIVPVHQLLTSSAKTKEFKKKIEKLPLDLGVLGPKDKNKCAFLLKNVFSPEECASLISKAEETGFVPALVESWNNQAAPAPGYRDSDWVLMDDREFSDILFKRIGHHLPAKMLGDKLLGINERLRFLRYRPGGKFTKHCDGGYVRPDGSALTQISLQIYLNDVVEGGETTFFPSQRSKIEGNPLPIRPETGMILAFEHNLLHEGSLVREGTKYTIRTDVLYKIK